MLHCAGIGASAGIAIALVILLVQRLLLDGGLELSLQSLMVIAAIGLVAGAIWPMLKLPDAAEIALQLDRTLHLKDRVATAHAMTNVLPTSASARQRTGPVFDNEFASLVQREAEQLSSRIDVRSVTPIRVTSVWGMALGLGVALWIAFMFVPTIAWAGDPQLTPQQQAAVAEQHQQEQREQRAQLLAEIEEAVGESADEAAIDDRTREQMAALERLAQQLQTEPGDEQDLQRMRDEAAARMSELSARLDEQTRRERVASEKLAERFSGMQTPETPMSAQEFSEALQRGDFGRAADALEDLLQQRDELTPEQRRELAEHLHDLNDQLEASTERDRQNLQEQAEQLQQALRDQGLSDEQIAELLDDFNAGEQDLANAMRDQHVDEDVAQRLARELKRMHDQQHIDEQVDRDSQAVRDALRDAADEFDPGYDRHEAEPPIEDPHDDQAREDDDPAEDSDEAADRADEAAEQVDEQDEQRADGDAQQQQEQEQAQQQREEGEERSGVQEDQAQEHAGEEGEQQAHEADDAQPGEADEDTADQAGPSGEEEDAEVADGDPDATGEGAGGDQFSEQQSPSETLREMQQRQEGAERRRETSERMRERARRMSDPDSQQTAEHMSDGDDSTEAGAGGAEAGSASTPLVQDDTRTDAYEREVEDLDVRRDSEDPGELIAEWMGDDVVREGDPTARRAESQRRIREAQEIAERAVNDAAVPNRYHERIRRYFGRLNETVERATDSSRDNSAP